MTLKVLIVDDNAQVRAMIRRFIADLIDEIREDDGETAFDSYAAFRPDWVLMDIEMKHTNGIAATARIKAAYPQANILIVTSHNDDQLRASAAEAGACGYVLKENLLDLRGMLTADAMKYGQKRRPRLFRPGRTSLNETLETDQHDDPKDGKGRDAVKTSAVSSPSSPWGP